MDLPGSPSDKLEDLVRRFVVEAVEALAKSLGSATLPIRAEERWHRGNDGCYRRQTRNLPDSTWAVLDAWDALRTLPSYEKAVQAMAEDPLFGPHLNKLVGTDLFLTRIEADDIAREFVTIQAAENGKFEFDGIKFQARWDEIAAAFLATEATHIAIVALPGLGVPSLPIELDQNLVIDALTEDEMHRCLSVGILRPLSPSFPVVTADAAVGVRQTALIRKWVDGDGETRVSPPSNHGPFGRRPPLYSHLLGDDVLTALRLLKAGSLRSPGVVGWVKGWGLDSGTSFSARPTASLPFPGVHLALDASEVEELRKLWRSLTSERLGTNRYRFLLAALRRFNFSFDRFLAEDRLVDLMIAAESLFLHETGRAAERGELTFRLALRASKFVEHRRYSQRQVYEVMRRAYHLRSAIVHGGEGGDTKLPDEPSASIAQFTDAVEEVLRLGLRKALRLGTEKFGDPGYWEDLLFPGVAGRSPHDTA